MPEIFQSRRYYDSAAAFLYRCFMRFLRAYFLLYFDILPSLFTDNISGSIFLSLLGETKSWQCMTLTVLFETFRRINVICLSFWYFTTIPHICMVVNSPFSIYFRWSLRYSQWQYLDKGNCMRTHLLRCAWPVKLCSITIEMILASYWADGILWALGTTMKILISMIS